VEKNRILILFAHPALHKSRVNKILIKAVQDLEHVTFHNLYEAYPEFDIDVQEEQKLLVQNDVVILHHPFYWYSTPAILKEWQDLVLEHNWAYGSKGKTLTGKKMLTVTTTGGSEAAYQLDGYNRNTIRQLLAPIEQTARLCGMEYLPPFVVHGTHTMTTENILEHAKDYRRTVIGLRDGSIDIEYVQKFQRLNQHLDQIFKTPDNPEN
jgi:glutathione-regulated potassium-efflux system ancillary protein KefG